MLERFVFNCILVRSSVADNQGRDVTILTEGGAYGHSIELVKNYALWPFQLTVHTQVRDARQLHFIVSGAAQGTWAFTTEVPPNFGAGEQTALMQCGVRQSGKDLLKTTIRSGRSCQDGLTLEVEIE